MPPPPPSKRIKRPAKVIDEDTYTDALSHIIARDFFPGLVEAESQQDYLNALDSQDSEWIESAGRKLTEVMTPGPDGRRIRGRRGTSMTPMTGLHGRGGDTPKGWGGDTPMSVVSTPSTATTTRTEKPDVDTNLSLGAFQRKYTSEDNESFYRLLDKQNLKKSEKYAWMWADNKIPAARQIAHRQRRARLLAARNADDFAAGATPTLAIEDVTLDQRPAMPDSWPSRPENNLMFGPASVEDAHPTVQQRAEETSRAAPKAVVYDNTRLPPAPTDPDPDPAAAPSSPSLSAIHAALASHPRPSASEAAFASSPTTPRVNGYAFVDASPSPSPSPSSLLGPAAAAPNPFTIKDRSRREVLHHRMVDRVARGKRAARREAELRSPVAVPRFASSPRVAARGGWTPAAERLLGRVGGLGSGLGEGGTPRVGSGLRGEWRPGGA
ncbi:hypothetical protein MMC26_004491 [Xylographa opegraphella]|nr:hypothetical protein [Xylographa opegraphella]